MKYIKLFEEFSSNDATVLVIHMFDPIKDTLAFNFVNLADVIQLKWDDPEIEKKFEKYKKNIDGILLSGSPETPVAEGSPDIPDSILYSGIPLFGICYGMEYIMLQEGADVVKMDLIEKRTTPITIDDKAEIFRGLESPVWGVMSHQWEVKNVPTGYDVIATGQITKVAGVQNLEKKIWGLQFHPEKNWLDETIFRNFIDIIKREKLNK
jgi:GMP synthase-like glutamine amidotransferase